MKEKKSLKAILTGIAFLLITLVSPFLFMVISYLASRHSYSRFISPLGMLFAGGMMLALINIASKIILSDRLAELRGEYPFKFNYLYEACNLSILFLGPMFMIAITLILASGLGLIVDLANCILR